MMTRDHIKMARKKMFYSSAKAMRELGYAPRPLRAGGRGRGRLVPRQRHAADMTTLAVLSLLIWLYLLLAHGRFWQSGPELAPARPAAAPPVAVVVPARDEAPLIGQTLRSLLAQDYAGPLRIILVDDGSSDGTGAIARALGDAAADRAGRAAASGRLERQAVGGGAGPRRDRATPSWSCSPTPTSCMTRATSRPWWRRRSAATSTWCRRWWRWPATRRPSTRWCRPSCSSSSCCTRSPG